MLHKLDIMESIFHCSHSICTIIKMLPVICMCAVRRALPYILFREGGQKLFFHDVSDVSSRG